MATYGVKLLRSDDLQLEAHRDGCTEETFAEWCVRRRAAGDRLAVDLFSGAGGLSLGLQKAGWTVALAVDTDPKALQTHRHNFSGIALSRDLGDPVQRRELLQMLRGTDIDLVAGGPPCQPFSRAGRNKIRSLVLAGHRAADDHRRELWKAFLEMTLEIHPRAVLMENVPDMGLTDDFLVIRTMIAEFEQAGYHCELRLVDTWAHGVPQHRKRLILLARLDSDCFAWPKPVPQTNIEDAIRDLPELGDGIGERTLPYQRSPGLSAFAQRMRAGMPRGLVWDHMTRPVREDDREIFSMMDSKTLYADIPEHLRRYSADTFDDKYKRLGWKELSRTITAHIAKDGYWYIHPAEARTLTVREAARIQTFPDVFRFAGTRSDAFRQIGNAVPPLLGEAAALALAPLDSDPDSPMVHSLQEARRDLTAWAKTQRKNADWYFLPGKGMTHPVAALTALLIGRGTPPLGVRAAVNRVRGRDRLLATDLQALETHFTTPFGRAVLARVRMFAEQEQDWHDVDKIIEALAMRPAQARMFQLLCGRDILLTNQATIRVAARLAGSDSAKVNRLSNGRVDLATLVGAGAEAPLRTAALNLLGNTRCRETASHCASCPLLKHCPSGISSAEANAQEATLF